MGRKKGPYKKKDKFDALESEFKDAVMQSSSDEIKKRVSEIALLQSATQAFLKVDPDVLQAKATLKGLTESSRETIKLCKLRIEFCQKTLTDKGIGTPTPEPETARIVVAKGSKPATA